MSDQHSRTSPLYARGFTRRHVVLGTGLVATGVLGPMSSAAANQADSTPTVAGETASEGEPRSGGTVTLGYTDEPPTMDPRVSGSAKATNLLVNLFDTLLALDDETGELQPGLATEWEGSEDGSSYTFTLRDDVLFHDGTPFNAEAVKYTFDSIVDPELRSLTAIGYLGPYDGTEVVDEFTVRVNFTEPYPAFLNLVAATPLAPVSPTAAEESGPTEFARAPVGTGPFRFVSWDQQVSMSFEKNPDYNWPIAIYRHEGPAYLDGLTVNFIPEASTLAGSLESGQLTIADGIPPQDIERFQEDDEFQVLLPPIPGSPQILPINANKAPTDELAVRQAMNYGVDTETIVDTMFFGTQPAAHGPLAEGTWSYNPAVEEYYPYDPERAAQLLDEAGWVIGSGGVRERDGQRLALEYITQTGAGGLHSSAGELVQAYLTQVGFEVNLQVLEYAATAELMLQGEHHIGRIGYTGTDPSLLTTLYHSENITGTNFNRTMKPDPTLDQMLDEANAETDRQARLEKYQEIQVYIMDQALMIPLWEQTVYWGADADLKGLHPMSLGQIPFYNAWLDE